MYAIPEPVLMLQQQVLVLMFLIAFQEPVHQEYAQELHPALLHKYAMEKEIALNRETALLQMII
jgi:hypothetical protein